MLLLDLGSGAVLWSQALPGLPGDPPSASLPTADHRSAFFFWGIHEPTDSNQTVESWVVADNVGQTQWLGACKETESPGAGRDEGDWEDGGKVMLAFLSSVIKSLNPSQSAPWNGEIHHGNPEAMERGSCPHSQQLELLVKST